MLGGYFHRGYGFGIHFPGEFRHYGDYLVNFGLPDALNSAGVYNHFLSQKLEKVAFEPKLLGLHMTWLFENENPNTPVDLTDDSYFYVERVKSLTKENKWKKTKRRW